MVQGAGGNTSVKTGRVLSVKASGWFLKNLASGQGFVNCDYNLIKKYLFKIKAYSQSLEPAFAQFISGTLKAGAGDGQPSIETGLHAVIPSKYVFHTHSVFANVFNFASEGQRALRDIFADDELLFIGYKNPGLELALALSQELKRNRRLPSIVFLKNHGLITHHNNAEAGYNLTLGVQRKLTSYLKKQKVYKPFVIKKKAADLSRHMFPDSVVYSQVDFSKLSEPKKRVYYEICSMISYTRDIMERLTLRPIFLPEAKVKFLKNMGQEKHRIKLFVKQ